MILYCYIFIICQFLLYYIILLLLYIYILYILFKYLKYVFINRKYNILFKLNRNACQKSKK